MKHHRQLQQLVNDLRNELHNRTVAGLWMTSSLTKYSQIRPYLHPEVRKALEASRSEGETPTEKSDDTYRRINILEKDLARIERDWDLL